MRSKFWLLGLILAIPIIAFAVAEGIQAHFNSELRAAIRQNYPNADPEKLTSFTVDLLCKDPELSIREICDTNANLNLMRKAALGSAGAGLALLLVIYLGGVSARNSRKLLLSLFKPGLYLTASMLLILILIYGVLAMAAIYYGESALFGRIHVKIIVLIGIGALVGVFVLARNAFALIKKAQTSVIGTALSHDEAPKLWGKIEQLSDKLGALRPQNIVVGLDPNFFVTEADTLCLNGNLSGRTLYCSLPLCRILSEDEFCSVIGHELGHFKGLDTQYSERFYPIYRGTASSIAALQETGGEGAAQIALLPAIAVLSYFFECFSVAESRISRFRELAADEVGASVASSQSLASALVKLHAFSGFWSGLQQAAAEALQKGNMFINASKTYAEVVASSDGNEALKGILETHTPHPTDSHPPLGTRLDSLKVTLEEISPVALAVNPENPALNLMESPERKEEELSAAYQMILAKRLGIDLDEPSEGKSRSDSSEMPVCPHCGASYTATDYRQDAQEWFCRQCGKALPRGG
jgi:Zn-dependent protease with chaperone function